MILGVLQARVSSTRLPGKVLRPVLGEPMLARQIERVRRAQAMDRLIVATSTAADDDAIAALCGRLNVDCFRGSLDDVLDRFYHAAVPHQPSHVVRLTGDCPLVDWIIVDRAIAACCEGRFDYVSNALQPTWPDGLDVEVMTFAALEVAWHNARLPSEREHVTPFIYKNPERFRLYGMINDRDLSAHRWTVDEPADFTFVTAVYEALYRTNPAFGTNDVLDLLDQRPEIAVNFHHERNAGMKKSIEADRNAVGVAEGS